MNKAIYTLLFLALVSFSACSRYLDIKPHGVTVPKTAEEFAALLHTRLSFIDDGRDPFLVGNSRSALYFDMYGDDFEPALFTSHSNLLPISIKGELELSATRVTTYQSLYQIIRDCNIIIAELKDDGSTLSGSVLGTSYAMRGVAYYQLMRLYCEAPEAGKLSTQKGLPIVLVYDIEAQVPRSDLQSLVNAIEADLDKAQSYDVTDPSYYFTAEVVRGYKARLYHWTQQWAKALETAEALLTAHPLLSAAAFTEMIKNTEIKGNFILRNPTLSYDQADANSIALLETRPLSRRYVSLFAEDERDRDVRAQLYFNTKRIVTRPPAAGMRSAEFALIAAESYYHLGQEDKALQTLNSFRAIRIDGATPFTMGTLPAPSPLEYIKQDASGRAITPLLGAILAERRKEFLLEGDRFFELKRNGSPEFWKAYNGERYDMLKYMYTLPIPLRDLALQGDLVQNPVYDDYTIGR